jgi:hypothetical protein
MCVHTTGIKCRLEIGTPGYWIQEDYTEFLNLVSHDYTLGSEKIRGKTREEVREEVRRIMELNTFLYGRL